LSTVRNDHGGTSPEGESRRLVDLWRYVLDTVIGRFAANPVSGSPRRSILS
jgi:hypothetical protein